MSLDFGEGGRQPLREGAAYRGWRWSRGQFFGEKEEPGDISGKVSGLISLGTGWFVGWGVGATREQKLEKVVT